jgi:glucose-1-phosphate cytidylyltransferase
MQVVLLAGGLGTRISEETLLRPKPMIEIGGQPILWHIMKLYSHHGINDFIVCLGYKSYVVKDYFVNYVLHRADVTVDMQSHNFTYHRHAAEPWRVTLVDTGQETMTGGRLKRVRSYLKSDEPFCMTYGDGVSDVDIKGLIEFHRAHGLLATLTAVKPPGRYGATKINNEKVVEFMEKPAGDGGYINGGFFVLQPSVIDRIADDATPWESEPLQKLAADGQLAAYRHNGFWHAMDTLRDKNYLEQVWQSGRAPWMVWT